jgi:DNA repair protein RadC
MAKKTWILPSQSDLSLTDKVKKAAEVMDIKLLDHLILTECGFYSFADEGRM